MTLTDWNLLTSEMQKFRAVHRLVASTRTEVGEESQTGHTGSTLAQLFDPARRESLTVTLAFARYWCAENPGWMYETL